MKAWRSNLVFLIMLLVSAAVTSRLIYIQVMNSDYWRAFAQGQQNIFENISGDRGKIYFSGSSLPIATKKISYFVYLSTPEVTDPEGEAKKLSELLDLDESFILGQVGNKQNLFAVLKEKLSDQEVESLENLELPGVYIKEEEIRYYPQEDL